MANYRVGRVGIVPQGAYSATKTYEPLDLVEYNGGSYVNKSGCTGVAPTDTAHWQVSAQKGSDGAVPLPLAMSQVSGLSDALAAKLDKAGGTVTGTLAVSSTAEAVSQTTGALVVAGGLGVGDDIYANRVFGAVWNDYAERRIVREETVQPGQVVCECGDDTLALSTRRLQPLAYVITDTYGFEIGKRDALTQPVGVSGRVLVTVEGNLGDYHVGDALCSAPQGKACKMTAEEAVSHPECVLGYVCCVPDYDTWADIIPVNGRVWMRIR